MPRIIPFVVVLSLLVGWVSPAFSGEARPGSTEGVCPAFHLFDEEGNVIDPVHGANADRPYSPKQTCGKCHDYEKITKSYHFTMGKGHAPTPDQADRCRWALSPGQYGGTWSTPGPLFPYLSPKKNASPRTMDLTSFTVVGQSQVHGF